MHFLKKYSNINKRLCVEQFYHFAEMSEWFKEHDWKSCVGLKLTGGSNPLLCAKNMESSFFVSIFFSPNLEEYSRVGATSGSEYFAFLSMFYKKIDGKTND